MLNSRNSSLVGLLVLGALAVGCGDDSGSTDKQLDAQVKSDAATGIVDAGLDARVSDASTAPCPGELQCTAASGLYLCTKSAGSVDLCEQQSDCAVGTCYKLAGQGICLQLCTPSEGLPSTTSISGTVVEFEPGKGKTGTTETPQETVLANVKVCLASPAAYVSAVGCTQTSADGKFTLNNVPPNRNVAAGASAAISFEKDGYLPQLQGVSLQNGSQTFGNQIRLLTLAYANNLATKTGSKLPDQSSGWLQVETVKFDVGGADSAYTYLEGTLKLTTLEGVSIHATDAGIGPVYLDGNEQPLVGGLDGGVATATSPAGEAFFVGVPPGTYQVTYAHPTLTCGDTPSPAPVVPGFLFAGVSTACGNGVKN